MLSEKSQATVDATFPPIITQLKELIREGDEPTAMLGAMKLLMIGTREATEAIMDVVRTIKDEDPELTEMVVSLVIFSPFRAEYRAELEDLMGAELVAETYGDADDLDPRILGEPIWETVAKALEAQFAQE